MAIKRYVQGQGWVEVANNSSSFGKATNISITDANDLYDSSNVEGALSEIAYDIKQIKRELLDHETNHPSGGGGGGTGTLLPTISSDFEINTSDGETPIEIPIFFNSPNLGDGTCYIMVKNIEVKTQQISQGNNTIVVPPIGAGNNINISIYVKDRAGLMSNQLTWIVTAGGISMKLITDTTVDFSLNNKIALSYNISCVSTEAINAHFLFKGTDYYSGEIIERDIVLSAKTGYNSYQVTEFGVGVYHVTYWAESGDYRTADATFTLVIVDDKTVLVSTDFDSSVDCEAGIPISIPYRVSIDKDEDFNVDLYIDDVLHKSITTRPSYLYWSVSSLDTGSHNMRIHAYSTSLGLEGSLEFTCNVVQGEYSRIQPIVDASLLCWFDATENTNNDSDRDIWTDKICGNIGRLYNFNYGSNGWIREEGSAYSELKMDGTSYVEIDMKPFANNFKNGATIELVFKARDVGNDAARILDITDSIAPYKGVYIDTREAYLSTESQTVYASVGEDEYIHVMYEIDRDNKYCHVIINGVITKSCRLSDSGSGTSAYLESVMHNQKIYLNSQKGVDLFGSCEVKHLRIYDRALSFEEILQNYLSTFEDLSTQKAKADFNDAAKKIMPIMNITADEDTLAKMTDTNQVEVSMSYTSPNSELYGETLTTATNCLMYWQGTSSIAYNIKNYNLLLRDSNRQEIEYSPYPNCIPQSLFCLKANLMESTNAHNVGLADFVRKYLYTKNNPAQDIDPRASRTIQGFPFLLYINQKLIGVYDFNLDRYSTKAFGYELPQHKNCRVYEISANTNKTAGAFVPWSADTGVDEWTWFKNDFKGIYPTDIQNPINDDYSALKELVNFVSNSNDEVFKTNFSTYFDKESVIRYYIMVMVFGLVDSLGKNAKLVTYDGIKWYFEFYDMDTAMGLDNTGAFKYDVDIEINVEEFNTAESRLWSRVNTLFHDDIVNEYNNMRNGALTLDNIYECLFTNQIEKIPEYQYNLSTQAKYLDAGTYIMMSNGNRYYNLKRWLKERLIYCDTLFGYSPTTANFITVRSGIIGPAYIDISTYYPMYITVKWRNVTDGSANQTVKIGRNKTVRISAGPSDQPQSKDQEIIIYGAEHLKNIGKLEGLMPRHLYLSNAYRLTSLECPENTDLINVDIAGCTYLQKVDLRGCSNLGTLQDAQVLNVSGCNNLRYLNAYGTVVKSIDINQSGGNLVELYVPKTLQTLSLKNQYSLRVVGIPGATSLDTSDMLDIRTNSSNIANFTLINCPLVERLNYDENFVAGGAFFDNYANERKNNELSAIEYEHGTWKHMMSWSVGLANCNTIYIENSCHNVPSMSFRSISQLSNLTLRAMPHLKALMIGANCCGYRTSTYASSDIYSEFDWQNGLTIIDCNNIEEFRIHEMFPNNYLDGKTGNLTYFTFKPGTDSLKLSDKFPNLKLFECNLITQNIHQIILPQTLKTLITCAWHQRHDEGYSNEAKIAKFNIDSIYFEGEHDNDYVGVDLGGHAMTNTRIVAPFATELIGVNIVNDYVNPVFNELKESKSTERPFIAPNGSIDISNFKWRNVSDWFAYMDFTKSECDIRYPDDWDTFLKNITKADNMFRYCTNPEITWEFAMKFFPKINNMSSLTSMYQYAQLAEQKDFDTDGVELYNTYNITGYTNSNHPFIGSNLKFIKSIDLTGVQSLCYAFVNSNLVRVGDISFTGTPTTSGINTMGLNYLFSDCKSLEEVGNIFSSTAKAGGTEVIPMNSTFQGCSKLKKIGELDIAVSTMENTFRDCSVLTYTSVNLPDMTYTTRISSIFRNCVALTEMTLNNIDNVIQADYMFRGCTNITKISLPGIGPDSLLQDIQNAFANCKKLTEIEIGGETLPKEIRVMESTFESCQALNKLPAIPEFTYDVTMKRCFNGCKSLTHDNMYKVLPFKVTDVTEMYYNCTGLIAPEIEIRSDHVIAKQMFRGCTNMTSLSVDFSGRLLRDCVKFADSCSKLKKVDIVFPYSLLMHEYYGTGVTYYNMFIGCTNLQEVNFDMERLKQSNTKADFGAMFAEVKYLTKFTGFDFSCLKKPIRNWVSSQGTYDSHDVSITYGGDFSNLTDFEPVGLLGLSYDFKNITSLAHTKTILRHLATVTSETLGLTYNINDAIDDTVTDNVDQELKELALDALNNKGWSFTIV